MPDEIEDELEQLHPGASELDGLRRRTGMQGMLIKQLKRERDEARGQVAERDATIATNATALEATTAEHATALEAASATHNDYVARSETSSAMSAAGVKPEGLDFMLSQYKALGDDAPDLTSWLAKEDHPPHIAAYLGGEPQAKQRPNSDAKVSGRTAAGGATPDFANMSGDDMSAYLISEGLKDAPA